jgi:hypothetical protein
MQWMTIMMSQISSTYVCVFKNFLLGGLWHEDGVELEFLKTSVSVHIDGVLIWRTDDRVITLEISTIECRKMSLI